MTPRSCTLGSAAFPALGTSAEILVTRPGSLTAAVALLRTELAALDRACSRFRPDSELVEVNRGAGAAVPAGPLLRRALRVALVAAVQTHGDVDPTLGRCLRELGYDRAFTDLPVDGPARPLGHDPGAWRHIDLDDSAGTITVPEGVELDLGATAKAFGADRATALVSSVLDTGVLVNLGGDIATAGPAPAGGWRVRVADHPRRTRPGDREQTVAIRGGALATSSTTVRTWTRDGVGHHHLLDPRTGQPVAPVWRTVTVTAGSCVDANTAATAAIVAGTAAPGWLDAVGLPARLVSAEGDVVTLGGWPADDTPLAA
ncbi:MAG: FAD:protein FMN transferase [Pseudonocardia sp.]